MDFAPDPRIAADSAPVASLELCDVRLQDDARFPWLVLIPRIPGATELTDLPPDLRAALIEEGAACADALRASAPCDKINIGALGNIVAQLHVHVVARTKGDPAWPGPVWGSGPAAPYDPAAREALIARLRDLLRPGPGA